MKKNAYHFLFQQNTLYRATEPEPFFVPPVVEPEPVLVLPVEEEEVDVRPEIALITERVETPPEPPIPLIDSPVGPVIESLPQPLIVELEEPIVEPLPQPLVVMPEEPTLPEAPRFNQKVLIVVDEELTPSEQLFLQKILKAIQLDLNGVDLLNLAGSGILDFHSVLETKAIHHFISFGVPFPTLHLDIHMDRYHPVRIFGITFLLADPISAVEADEQLKRKLWAVLKKIFLEA